MSDKASNVFSFCIGGLALISSITSTILYYHAFLPNAQMKILDDLLRETKDIYIKAEADGLLPGAVFRGEVRKQLSHFERASESLREHAYQATTLVDEYIGLVKGLSAKITRIAHDVKKLRSSLITTSQRERLRREQELAQSLDQSPDTSQPGAAFENASSDIVTTCLPGAVEDSSSPLSLSLLPVLALFADCRMDILGITEWLSESDNRQLLSRALGVDGASLTAEQLAVLSTLLDRRSAQCYVCNVVGWWNGEVVKSTGDILRNLEDQPTAIDDTVSLGSSTLVEDVIPRKPRLFMSWWRRVVGDRDAPGKASPQRPWSFFGFRAHGVGDQDINTNPLPP